MKCSCCGRDINAIGQDNVSYNKYPLCEDCGRGNNTNIDEQIKIIKGANNVGDIYIFKIDDQIRVTTKPKFEIIKHNGESFFEIHDVATDTRIHLKEFDYDKFWEDYTNVLRNVHYTQDFTDSNPAIVIEIKDQKLSIYSV